MIDGILIAADVKDIVQLEHLIDATYDIPGVIGYKIGFYLALKYGLAQVVEFIRDSTEDYPVRVVYDHQKAGNDIPEMGEPFADLMEDSDVDDVILFPFTGFQTTQQWIQACKNHERNVLFGCIMTHKGFFTTEGGVIDPAHVLNNLALAVKEGVTRYVFPGVFHTTDIRKVTIEALQRLKVSADSLCIYTPGIGAQGGSTDSFQEVASLRPQDMYIPIVGQAIYTTKDMRKSTLNILSKTYGNEQ